MSSSLSVGMFRDCRCWRDRTASHLTRTRDLDIPNSNKKRMKQPAIDKAT